MLKLKKDEALVLRTCDSELKSYGGFQWPASGVVEAPDWDSLPNCGRGLHGLLWGCGNSHLLATDDSTVWLVCRVKTEDVVDLGDKVKFPRAEVVFTGSRREAVNLICRHAPAGSRVVYSFVKSGHGSVLAAGGYSVLTAGDISTLTAEEYSTLTAGDGSTLTAGYDSTLKAKNGSVLTAGSRSTLTSGDDSTLTAGMGSKLEAGDFSTLTAGSRSALTAGDDSTLTAESGSTLTAGSDSTLTAGSYSTLTAGHSSTLKAGGGSTLTAGNDSTLTAGSRSVFSAGENSVFVTWWNKERIVAIVGKDDIKPGVAYKYGEDGWEEV